MPHQGHTPIASEIGPSHAWQEKRSPSCAPCSRLNQRVSSSKGLGVARAALLRFAALPFRLGAGGRVGSGRQWVPWIHIDDLVALALAVLDDDDLRGPINAVAPEPVRNAELTRLLGRVLKRPTPLPVPGWVLRAALGDLAGELLGSRRVVPQRACASGFAFAYSDLETALARELRGSGRMG